jgi:putative heme degradation protein
MCRLVQARITQLQAEADALDQEIAALLPAAESTLVIARQKLDAVSLRAFEAHLTDQSNAK